MAAAPLRRNTLQADLLRFADADLRRARREGEIMVAQTKYGTLILRYRNGQYELRRVGGSALAVGKRADVREALARAYAVVNANPASTKRKAVAKPQARDLTAAQVRKLIGHLGTIRGSGREWEIEVPDEGARRKAHRGVSGLGGYRTGYGAWVLSPRYVPMGDYGDKASRWHYNPAGGARRNPERPVVDWGSTQGGHTGGTGYMVDAASGGMRTVEPSVKYDLRKWKGSWGSGVEVWRKDFVGGGDTTKQAEALAVADLKRLLAEGRPHQTYRNPKRNPDERAAVARWMDTDPTYRSGVDDLTRRAVMEMAANHGVLRSKFPRGTAVYAQGIWDDYRRSRRRNPARVARPAARRSKQNPFALPATAEVQQARGWSLPKAVREAYPFPNVDPGESDLAIWAWEEDGKLYAMAFEGRGAKPLWYHRFRSAESLQEHVADSIRSRVAWLDRKDQEAKKRKEYRHSVKIGDVFYTSWGYDETHVDWYQVVGVSEKSVTVRAIGSRTVSEDRNVSYVAPVVGQFLKKSPSMRVVVREGGHATIDGHGAYLWSGKPVYETTSGWGH